MARAPPTSSPATSPFRGTRRTRCCRSTRRAVSAAWRWAGRATTSRRRSICASRRSTPGAEAPARGHAERGPGRSRPLTPPARQAPSPFTGSAWIRHT
ncbi:hypothetical protein AB852_10960 [Streptomyces uncialis]|uniref:Uncharacterized protein n=1 Tax=Streptomyces uncialis TaxID=1048205 RepID=A0A1Q4VA24_9ACTN|nr:hypothetical protein AB852_10960 [Streptomyces uncialis]